MFSFVLQTVSFGSHQMFCQAACAPSHYYKQGVFEFCFRNKIHLFPEVVSPGQGPDLLLSARTLLGDPHAAIRDDVESVPGGSLPHNVLT